MPAELRPDIRPPTLSRESCKELPQMLCEQIGDLEALWAAAESARRN